MFLNHILVPTVGAKDGNLTLRAVTLGASQKILWEQVVTCSGHSKEHFKTNLAEYWGREVHGRSSYLPDYGQCPTTFCYKHTTGY